MKNQHARNRQLKAWQRSGGWRRAVFAPVSVVNHPDRVMVAANEFYSGRAVWYFETGIWACRSADECLAFMLRKSVKDAQLELTKRGFKYEWLKP